MRRSGTGRAGRRAVVGVLAFGSLWVAGMMARPVAARRDARLASSDPAPVPQAAARSALPGAPSASPKPDPEALRREYLSRQAASPRAAWKRTLAAGKLTHACGALHVRFRPDATEAQRSAVAVAAGGRVKGYRRRGARDGHAASAFGDLIRVGGPAVGAQASGRGACACLDRVMQLEAYPGVAYAAPASAPRPSGVQSDPSPVTPDDPWFPFQDSLQNAGQSGGTPGADIQAPGAWGFSPDASNVVVAVLDWGLDQAHPEIAPNLWTNPNEVPGNGIDDDENGYIDDVHGWNFTTTPGSPNTQPVPGDLQSYHGTAVAGVLAARGNDGQGMTGVAWSAQLMALSFSGTGDYIAAIQYAIDHGADILNMSWGSPFYRDPALEDAIAAARAAGILVIAAAGENDAMLDVPAPSYPAAMDGVIGVGAVNNLDEQTLWTSFGGWVDLVAPGERVLAPWPDAPSFWLPTGEPYAFVSGTSYAAAEVSGVAALVLGRLKPRIADRAARLLAVEHVLMSSTDAVADPKGRINALTALRSVSNASAPTTPTAVSVRRTGNGWADLTVSGASDDQGVVGYRVEVSTDGISFADSGVTYPAGGGIRVQGLSPSTTYWFRVRAIDAAGSLSAPSAIYASATTLVNNPPRAPDRVQVDSLRRTGEWATIGRIYDNPYDPADPDGDPVTYIYDCGDGMTASSSDEMLGYEVHHRWLRAGIYPVRVKARDPFGAESAWTDPVDPAHPALVQVVVPAPTVYAGSQTGVAIPAPLTATVDAFANHPIRVVVDPGDGNPHGEMQRTFAGPDGFSNYFPSSPYENVGYAERFSGGLVYRNPGVYQPRVKAVDANGDASDWISLPPVTVLDRALSPIAGPTSISFPSQVRQGEPIPFFSVATSFIQLDLGEGALQFSLWGRGYVVFQTPGPRTVRARGVENGNPGAPATAWTAQATVDVLPTQAAAPEAPPMLRHPHFLLPGEAGMFVASGAAGALTYEFQLSGPGGGVVSVPLDFPGATTATATRIFPANGYYVVRARGVSAAGAGPWTPWSWLMVGSPWLGTGFDTYAPPLVAGSVAPSSVFAGGGTSVTIRGDIPFGSTVEVDGIPVPAATVSSDMSSLTFVAPSHAPGIAELTIRSPAGESAVAPCPYVSMIADSIAPAFGGKTSVHVSGNGFQPGAVVRFAGQVATSISVDSATRITCRVSFTAPQPEGPVDVVVTNPDGVSATLAGGYYYIPPPIGTAISPASGPRSGGTLVTITGSGFKHGDRVIVDGKFADEIVESASVSVVDSGTLTFMMPAHTAVENVTVTVQNVDFIGFGVPGGFDYTLAGYQAPPTISSVSPAFGPTAGGTSVTLAGSGFESGDQVLFGDGNQEGSYASSVVVDGPTQLRCVTPYAYWGAGFATVRVIHPDKNYGSLASAFEYQSGSLLVSKPAPGSGGKKKSAPGGGTASGTTSGGRETLSSTSTSEGSVSGSGTTTSSATGSVTTTSANRPPVSPAVLATPNPTALSQPVAFSLSSMDLEGDAFSFEVDFGDGSPVQTVPATGGAASVSHAYASAGVYTARVTARDASGAASMATSAEIYAQTVRAVIENEGSLGTVEAGQSMYLRVLLSTPLNLPASAFPYQVYVNLDTNPIYTRWEELSYVGTLPGTLGGSSGPVLVYAKPVSWRYAGTYALSVKVRDASGVESADGRRASVTVAPAGPGGGASPAPAVTAYATYPVGTPFDCMLYAPPGSVAGQGFEIDYGEGWTQIVDFRTSEVEQVQATMYPVYSFDGTGAMVARPRWVSFRQTGLHTVRARPIVSGMPAGPWGPSATVDVFASAGGAAPGAPRLTAAPAYLPVNQAGTFSATGGADPEGAASTYVFYMPGSDNPATGGSGGSSASGTIQMKYLAAGTYPYRVYAITADGKQAWSEWRWVVVGSGGPVRMVDSQ